MQRRRDTRTRNACVQCRTRKVRCDGRPGTCSNCERLSFDCSFRQSISSPDLNGSYRVEKLRTHRACSECRVHKIKCSGDGPVCSNCVRRRKACSFDTQSSPSITATSPIIEEPQYLMTPTPLHVQSPTPFLPVADMRVGLKSTTTPSTAFDAPSGSELMRMVEDYFHHVYPLPGFGFLHPTTTQQKCAEDTLDHHLVLALCSITALKMSNGRYFPRSTERWVEQAELAIWKDVDSPAVPMIQALILLICYRMESGKSAKAFMLAALAARMLSALHLNYERKELSPVQQEVRRRLVWTLAVLDGAFALGIPEYEICTFENIYVQLPCKEDVFLAGIPERTESLRHAGPRHLESIGCRALVVRLASMRRDIMRLNRQLTLSRHAIPYLEDLVQRFNGILSQIDSDIAQLYPYSPDMFQGGIPKGEIPSFLCVHLSLHQTYCDLYRLFLRGYHEATSDSIIDSVSEELRQHSVIACQQHSAAIVQLLGDVQGSLKSWFLLDYDNAICVYHATLLTMHFDQTSPDSVAVSESMRSKVNLTLDFLHRYFDACKLIEPMVSDLEQKVNDLLSGRQFGLQDGALSLEQMNQWSGSGHTIPREGLRHQRLAIHSLLRRSHFVDKDECADLFISSPESTMTLNTT